jgi:YVTN family beta-propeller protein
VTCEVAGTIDVLDVAARRVLQRIRLRPVDHPVGVVVTRDGKSAYAATGRGNAVVKIDTAANRVLQTIPAGARPWGVALSRDEKTLYAANGLSNDVSVIDLAAGRAVATIKAGDGPWGVCVAR